MTSWVTVTAPPTTLQHGSANTAPDHSLPSPDAPQQTDCVIKLSLSVHCHSYSARVLEATEIITFPSVTNGSQGRRRAAGNQTVFIGKC